MQLMGINMIKQLLLGLVIFAVTYVAQSDSVVLHVMNGCDACQQAEQLLNKHHIKYSTVHKGGEIVPQLWVNGRFKGYGIRAVEVYVKQ